MRRNCEADNDAPVTLTRRAVLGSAGVLVGLAGCASSDDGGDGSDGSTLGGDSEPADTEAPATDTPDAAEPATTATSTAPPIEWMCQVARNPINELSVVGCQSKEQGGDLVINMRVRNDGQQETDLFEYDYTATPYDGTAPSYSSNIGSGGQSTSLPGESVVQPGETGLVIVRVGIRDSASLSAVQRYTVTLECGTFSEGLYCG